MNRFPIGAVIELSPKARVDLEFLHMLMRSISYLPRALANLKEQSGVAQSQNLTPESEELFLDEHFKAKPFASLLSNSVVGIPVLNTLPAERSHINQNFCSIAVWCRIFQDLAENHNVDRKTWSYLKLNLLESPPNSQVIVLGWEFPSQLLGRGRSIGPKDICPDTPPTDLLS